jgi:2-phosphoglycerate kinase
MKARPPWQVLLFGGASGVGKTSVSYRLAQHYGVGITEVDDFQAILEGMTTPEQYPVLHYWRTHFEEARRMDAQRHVEFFRAYAATMAVALELVIANHLESQTPIVLEGDFLLPALAVQATYHGIAAEGRVRAVFLYEDDEAQIARNYLVRDGRAQPERARISLLVSTWLRAEAERLGLPAIPARPWETVLARVIAALEEAGNNT